MPVRTAYAGAAVAGEVLTAANVNKIPGGWIGYADVTANQGAITAVVDLTNLTVTVTVGASRRIKITADCYFSNDTANGQALLRIMEGATQLQQRDVRMPVATAGGFVHSAVVLTPTAGAHTYKLQAQSGLGILTLTASATFPCFIAVEDIGPAT